MAIRPTPLSPATTRLFASGPWLRRDSRRVLRPPRSTRVVMRRAAARQIGETCGWPLPVWPVSRLFASPIWLRVRTMIAHLAGIGLRTDRHAGLRRLVEMTDCDD